MSKVFDYYCPDGLDEFNERNQFDEYVECKLCGEGFTTDEFETICPACKDFTDYEDNYIKKIA